MGSMPFKIGRISDHSSVIRLLSKSLSETIRINNSTENIHGEEGLYGT